MRSLFSAVALLLVLAATPAFAQVPPDIGDWEPDTLISSSGGIELWLYEDSTSTYSHDMHVVYDDNNSEIVSFAADSATTFRVPAVPADPPTPGIPGYNVDLEDMPAVAMPDDPDPSPPDEPLPVDENGDPIPKPVGDEPGHDFPIFATNFTLHPVFSFVNEYSDTIYYRYIEEDTTGETWLLYVEGASGSAAEQTYASFRCYD